MVSLKIKDTGKETPNGNVVYSQIDSGNYITLYSGSIRAEGEKINTNYNTTIIENDLFVPPTNKTTAVNPVRFTLNIEITDVVTLNKLLSMVYTRGIKQMVGGNFIVPSMAYKNNDDSVYIIITNFRLNERLETSTNSIVLTLSCEQIL